MINEITQAKKFIAEGGTKAGFDRRNPLLGPPAAFRLVHPVSDPFDVLDHACVQQHRLRWAKHAYDLRRIYERLHLKSVPQLVTDGRTEAPSILPPRSSRARRQVRGTGVGLVPAQLVIFE